MSSHQYIKNIEAYDLRSFDHTGLKRELTRRFGKLDERRNLSNAGRYFAQHFLGWALIVLLDHWVASTIIATLMGLNLVGIFIVFHDAGHKTRSRRRWLNDALGDIAGGLFGFGTPWVLARESHKIHHHYAGRRDEASALWMPLTVAQYRAKSPLGRLAYRLKMTSLWFPFLEFGRFAQTLAAGWPRKRAKLLRIRPELVRSALVGLAINVGLGWGSYALMGWEGVFFLYVLPNFLSICFGAFFDRLNHANPEMRFYDADNWNRHESDMQGSIRVNYHPVVNYLINNMNNHPVHHYVSTIPGYNLKAAREYVDARYPGLFNSVEFSWGYLRTVYRACHLIESEENMRFVSFAEARTLPAVAANGVKDPAPLPHAA